MSSKWRPRLGSAFRFSTALRTLRSGLTTMMGTGEWERQYLTQMSAPALFILVETDLLAHATDSDTHSHILPCFSAPGADDYRVWAIQSDEAVECVRDLPRNIFQNQRQLTEKHDQHRFNIYRTSKQYLSIRVILYVLFLNRAHQLSSFISHNIVIDFVWTKP